MTASTGDDEVPIPANQPRAEPIDPRLAAAHARTAVRRAERAAFSAARQAGIARRHAARLRHHAETRWAEAARSTQDAGLDGSAAAPQFDGSASDSDDERGVR